MAEKTMTAEEVEQWRDAVRNAIDGELRAGDTETVLTACARLSAQAARVPGLEAQVDEMKRRAVGAEAERSDLAAKHLSALSERDAARERTVVLEQSERDLSGHVANLESVLAAERESLRLSREHVDSLRGRVADVEKEAHRLSNALALEQTTRDSAVQEAQSLRERVATLEAELAELRKAYDQEQDTAQEAIDRADTAEARVKELEETLARMKAGDKARADFLASQPPPAPAQGVDLDALSSVYYGAWRSESLRYREENGRRGWKDAAHRAGLAAVVARLSPTSPPGLREAVGKVLDTWGATFDDERERMESAMDALRAAYNATGVETRPAGWIRRSDVWEAVKAEFVPPDSEQHRRINDVLNTLRRSLNLDASEEAAHPDAVDAAKYRAAVERLPAAVDRIPTPHSHQVVEVLRWLLTLTTPPSGPGGGEGLEPGEDWGKNMTEPQMDAVMVEALREAQVVDSTRARIAPPEVPPQPTTPAVAWEGHGLKVDSDGEIDASESGYSESGIARVLARALAEAKREVAAVRKAHEAVQHAAKNESWATAGGDVLAIHSKRLEKDTADTAREVIRRFASRLGDDATGHDTDRSLEELEVALYQHVLEQEEKARHEAAESMRDRILGLVVSAANEDESPLVRQSMRGLEERIRALALSN